MRTLACGAATLAVLLAVAPTAALATAEVSGSPQEVNIKAQNSSIEEILAALSREFNIQYHSSASLERQLTGTYQGSLQRVLMRVLEGYNFIVKASGGQIEVTVFGTQKTPGTAIAATTPARSKVAPAEAKTPILEAKSPATSTKSVEQPVTSPPNKPSLSAEIKVAEGTLTKLVPTPSQSPAAPMPTSPAMGSGPELSPAKGQAPLSPTPGAAAGPAAAGAPPSLTAAPQAPGPTLGPAAGTVAPTAAPPASGLTQGPASQGGSLMPTPAPSISGPMPSASHQ